MQASRCGSHWGRLRPSFPAISLAPKNRERWRPRGPQTCKPARLQHLSLDISHSSPVSLETPDIREIDVGGGVRESDPLWAQPAPPFFGLTMSHYWHHLKHCWSWSWWPNNMGKFSFCEAFPPVEGDPSPFPTTVALASPPAPESITSDTCCDDVSPVSCAAEKIWVMCQDSLHFLPDCAIGAAEHHVVMKVAQSATRRDQGVSTLSAVMGCGFMIQFLNPSSLPRPLTWQSPMK